MILYKYRPWNKYTEDVIVHGRIFFPSKENLNDPAELVHPVQFQKNIWDSAFDRARKTIDKSTFALADEIGARFQLIEVIGEPYPEDYKRYAGIRDPFLKRVEAVYDGAEVHNALAYYALVHAEDRINLYGSKENILRRLNGKLESLGILSLSKRSDCPAMWAHYAANHTGVLLVFETEADPLLHSAKPVKYVSARPEITVDTVIETLYMKAETWSYEEEFRVIEKKGNNCYEFKEGALKGVVLGLRMKDNECAAVKSIARCHNLDVFQAVSDSSSYSISHEPVVAK